MQDADRAGWLAVVNGGELRDLDLGAMRFAHGKRSIYKGAKMVFRTRTCMVLIIL